MPKYTYIIVDENVAMKTIIPHSIKEYSDMLFSGYFSSATDALNYLKCNYCDLMFLSVELPDKNGFELLDSLESYPRPPLTVLLSSDEDRHSKKAHLYYSKGMIDFLHKNSGIKRIEISLDRFKRVVTKELFYPKECKEPFSQILTIGSHFKQNNFPLSQITHIVHERNYTYLHLYSGKKDGQYISLKQVEALLPAGKFIKISRSCIVMMDYILRCEEDAIIIRTSDKSTKTMKISHRRREQVLSLLKNMNLPAMQ